MKTIRKWSQKFSAVIVPLMAMMLLHCQPAHSEVKAPESNTPVEKDQSIMLAILLDTSNSMDGLIDQAKSQLWKIVNDLAGAKCDDGSRPSIRIALYEYGNDGLPSSEGYIRLVSPSPPTWTLFLRSCLPSPPMEEMSTVDMSLTHRSGNLNGQRQKQT